MEGMLTNYRIEHIMKEPSKVSDYDYDPYHVNRRFISTYLHELTFFDRIMNTKLVTLGFASEICADLIRVLYSMGNVDIEDRSPYIEDKPYMSHSTLANPMVTTIRNIYINQDIYPKGMVLVKGGTGISMSIANYDNPISINLTFNDASILANLLDSEELANMYVVNSNDIDERW